LGLLPDFGWAHFSLDEANNCSAGVTLRSFVISPFTGDFAYRLNVAAADYASSCAVAQRVIDAFEEAVVRTTPNGFVVWFDGVLVFVCVELAAPKEAHIGQRTRSVAGLWRVNFTNGPRE
jgi:hypothetical protein